MKQEQISAAAAALARLGKGVPRKHPDAHLERLRQRIAWVRAHRKPSKAAREREELETRLERQRQAALKRMGIRI
jgi:HAMP domain-containing protein